LRVQDTYEEIGKSTEECLFSGALLGTINEMEGFVKSYNKVFGKINICITGGDSQFFVLNMKTKILAFPFLVLQGLNEILNFNA
ncbi:MAG: pantothenate kinase, partial [Bacteroidia bacterium]|nr:pantothenate kinase [Bacteroidia bacterium]